MKKNNLLAIFLITTIFVGCSKDVNETYTDSLTSVTSLFIINTTEIDKPEDEKWISIKSKSRQTETSEEDSIPYYDNLNKSPTFVLNDSIYQTKREAGNEERIIPERHWSKGYTRKFNDSFCKCTFEGEYCYIWINNEERKKRGLTDEFIEEFSKKFANKFDEIYIKETALCGPKFDGKTSISNLVAHDDKISLVFESMEEYYWGFYRYNDMFTWGDATENLHINIDAAIDEKTQNSLISTMAHELNHKLNYDNKLIKYNLPIDSWYTEMLSMLVEDLFYEDLGIDRVDSSQQRLKQFIDGSYIYGFKNWTQTDHQIEGLKYANAYAFGAYLARNYGGAKLIHEICTNEFSNEDSVVAAVNKVNCTNKTFEDLLQEFPLVLININNEDKNLPSFSKSTSDYLEEIDDYQFKLNEINPAAFTDYCEKYGLSIEEFFSISSNSVDNSSKIPLHAYGFQFYSFKKPTNINLWKLDDLLLNTR